MSEEIKAAEGKEESFEELLNQSFKTLNNGDRVTGIVTAITPTEVQVDVGAKQAAYIKLSELSDDPNVKAEDIIHVGDQIETYVSASTTWRLRRAVQEASGRCQGLGEHRAGRGGEDRSGGTVTEENKGGVVVSIKGVRVFVPRSQSGQPRGADLSAW